MSDNKFAAVGGIVIRNGKVLLVRHTYGAAAGKLLNPGGMIQEGEMPADALKREILEETGVIVEPAGLLSIRCAPRNWYMVFAAQYISGEPCSDGAENSEAVFMDIDEALIRSDVTDTAKMMVKLARSKTPPEPICVSGERIWY